jgi:phosphoribulokinase
MVGTEFIARLENLNAHFIIGVAGDSGSGKSTFTRGITEILGPELVSSFSLDDYHLEDRETRARSGRLPLDPAVNRLELLAEHLAELKTGQPILKPNYDHKSGKFAPETHFEPTRIMIVEGLHPFNLPELRRVIDFGIFMDPEREVKWAWKLRRDIEKRGHDKKSVEAEMLKREPLFKLYIDPMKIYAEVVVKIRRSSLSPEGVEVELIQEIPETPLGAIDLEFDLSGLMRASSESFSMGFRSDFYYGKPVTRLTFDGHIHRDAVRGLERKIQDFTGMHERSLLEKGGENINMVTLSQLLICWHFLEKTDFLLRELEEALKRTD